MNKTDFMTYEEKVKALTEPPKPRLELSPKKEEVKPQVKETDTDPELEEFYEMYKFDWLSESGYTIYDLVDSIVEFAKKTKRTKELLEDSTQVVYDWENSPDNDIWLSYDEWLETTTGDDSAVSYGSEDDVQKEYDIMAEILDFLEAGYAADELVKRGYKQGDVEKAIQFSNFSPAK